MRGGRLPLPEPSQMPGPAEAFQGMPGYLAVLGACWAQEAEARPTFAQIVPELRWVGGIVGLGKDDEVWRVQFTGKTCTLCFDDGMHAFHFCVRRGCSVKWHCALRLCRRLLALAPGGSGAAEYAAPERVGRASSSTSRLSTAGVGSGGSSGAPAPITPGPSGSMEGVEQVRRASSDFPVPVSQPRKSMSAGI